MSDSPAKRIKKRLIHPSMSCINNSPFAFSKNHPFSFANGILFNPFVPPRAATPERVKNTIIQAMDPSGLADPNIIFFLLGRRSL